MEIDMSSIRVLVIGDVVGSPGREVCRELIPVLRAREKIDFIVANGENMAGGSGITKSTVAELFEAGVDVLTTGDHVFKRKEAYAMLDESKAILRPANYPVCSPGIGSHVYSLNNSVKIGIVNLLGRVFLNPIDCPFTRIKHIVDDMREKTNIILVDFHAEATSEKIALGWYLDGRVSCVYGTHTHVQTADETILPDGTAYITDLGMTGPFRSVLGRDIEAVLSRFVTQMPAYFKVATDDLRLSGALIEIETKTGTALSITRVQEKLR
jgi:2',3'-cyclic-nucleotide 2'-phosphodiesterase